MAKAAGFGSLSFRDWERKVLNQKKRLKEVKVSPPAKDEESLPEMIGGPYRGKPKPKKLEEKKTLLKRVFRIFRARKS